MFRLTWTPAGQPAFNCVIIDQQLKNPVVNVEPDQVTRFYHGKYTSGGSLGCHVQDNCSVTCTAHSTVANANHVVHAKFFEFLWDGYHPPLRHAGNACGSGVLKNQYR